MYTAEFIENLRSKMARAECLYCDKTFRDYKTLREHMRKKLHKKLNPSNTGEPLTIFLNIFLNRLDFDK